MVKRPSVLSNDQWAVPWLRRNIKLLIFVLMFGSLTLLCGGALMFTSGYLISRSATHPYNLLAVYVPIVLTRAFGIGRPVFRYLERLLSHNWVLRMTSGIRKQLYVVLEKDAVFFNERHRVGDMLGILADDIDHLQNMYLISVFPSLIALIVYVVLIISFGLVNLSFAIAMAVLFGLIIFIAPVVSLRLERYRKERQKQLRATSYRSVTDAVMGAYDWLISGRQHDFTDLSDQPAKKLNASLRQSRQFNRRRVFCLNVIFACAVVFVLLWAGRQFDASQSSANWIAAWALMLFPLFDAFLSVSQGVTDWPTYETSIKRLNGLKIQDEQLLPVSSNVPVDWQAICIQHLSFGYVDTPVLQDIDLTVPRGTKLAILGRSGVGKSTLLKLVTGDLAPDTGTVRLDETDVRSLHNDQSKLFGVLDQHPFLFNTSIINNVRLGNLSASTAVVYRALQQAGLEELIKSLPDGMDTIVEDNGQRFSGGEQQRIALARILIQDVPVILLDEPTVSLDPVTEQALLETIFKVCDDKTILWVTHHLQGVERADQVIFIKDGHIDVSGRPKQLYASSNRFRQLYQLDHGLSVAD